MSSFKPARGTLLAAAACALAFRLAAAAEIKFATLAPEGTDAMKLMRAVDAELRAKTGGELGFKFYAGGRQGDEKDMVRKIRLGQLQAGGFTGVGIGEIAPQVRILDAPWLFRDSREVDFVYKTFAPDFEKELDAKGYALLGWTEVGFVYLFSAQPVRAPEDLRRLKVWMWEGDPIAEAAFRALGVHPVPLSITDVNTSLQTGLINAVYNAPLYAIAMQWHEKTKYIYPLPIANASGAVLVSKKAVEALPEPQRRLLLEVSRRHLERLNALTRKQNEEALKTLLARGLKVEPPFVDPLSYDPAGRQARKDLVGRLYSAEFLDRVEKALAELRAKKGSSKT